MESKRAGESHFLSKCGGLSPEPPLTLPRDSKSLSTFVPRRVRKDGAMPNAGEFAGCALEESQERSNDPADRENDDDKEGDDDACSDERMMGGDPGEANGYHVLTQTERDVGEGFGRGSHGSANRGFATVRGEGDGTPE